MTKYLYSKLADVNFAYTRASKLAITLIITSLLLLTVTTVSWRIAIFGFDGLVFLIDFKCSILYFWFGLDNKVCTRH